MRKQNLNGAETLIIGNTEEICEQKMLTYICTMYVKT